MLSAVVARERKRSRISEARAMRMATSEQLFEPTSLKAALDRWLRPAVGFSHPLDVLKDPDLTLAEKRQVLSSWASDASSVRDEPSLRWLLGTPEPVPLSDVREALARLDLWELESGRFTAQRW
ncbi:MAG TPA: hypothetical protein VFE13_01855 [Caulobacteraceae bacterium]|nr:hypothetical protein [Caulobacteraceae bacterium]